MLLTVQAYARPVIIAVIDTGFAYNIESLPEKHLCKYGHKDFSNDQKWAKYLDTVDRVPLDRNGHGTNIVGVIDKTANGGNYCFVIIKWFGGGVGSKENDNSAGQAMKYAASLNPDIINISAGGPDFDKTEYEAVEKYLNNGGILVAAVGNNNKDLGIKGNTFYPAMYDKRIIVVGNKEKNGERYFNSNYGKPVKNWEVGVGVEAFGITGSGSSQATAIRTGKIVKRMKWTTK